MICNVTAIIRTLRLAKVCLYESMLSQLKRQGCNLYYLIDGSVLRETFSLNQRLAITRL